MIQTLKSAENVSVWSSATLNSSNFPSVWKGASIAEVLFAAVPATFSAVVQRRAAFLAVLCGRKQKKNQLSQLHQNTISDSRGAETTEAAAKYI